VHLLPSGLYKVTIAKLESRFDQNSPKPGQTQITGVPLEKARLMRLIFVRRTLSLRLARTPVDINGEEGGKQFVQSMRLYLGQAAYNSTISKKRGRGSSATSTTKVCSMCEEEKPLTAFGLKTGARDDYRSNCKTCGIDEYADPGKWIAAMSGGCISSSRKRNKTRPQIRLIEDIYGENSRTKLSNAIADQLVAQGYRESYSGRFLNRFYAENWQSCFFANG
jgi:hypothetical protein